MAACEGTPSPRGSGGSRRVSTNPSSNARADAFRAQSGVGERERKEE